MEGRLVDLLWHRLASKFFVDTDVDELVVTIDRGLNGGRRQSELDRQLADTRRGHQHRRILMLDHALHGVGDDRCEPFTHRSVEDQRHFRVGLGHDRPLSSIGAGFVLADEAHSFTIDPDVARLRRLPGIGEEDPIDTDARSARILQTTGEDDQQVHVGQDAAGIDGEVQPIAGCPRRSDGKEMVVLSMVAPKALMVGRVAARREDHRVGSNLTAVVPLFVASAGDGAGRIWEKLGYAG